MQDRQLYPDVLHAVSLVWIVVFHFFSWQILTYFPSFGIMFALGGWFVATSLNNNKSAGAVVFQRFARLMPTWWAFAMLAVLSGFFYARGAGVDLDLSPAWVVPYQAASWGLDNPYANDVAVVTWYIAAYLWLLVLSPFLLTVYKKLSWLAIYIPVFAMLIYSYLVPEQTILTETAFNVLTFGGCWMLGFARADGTLLSVPRGLVHATAAVCCACGIFLTYETGTLSSDPVALSLMSVGVAMLLLSFNPKMTFLPTLSKTVVRTINTFAVTIYLFHNMLIDIAVELGGQVHAYELGNYVGLPAEPVGQVLSFSILLVLIFITIKTIGRVETHQWIKPLGAQK